MEENKNLNNEPQKEEDKKKKKCGFLIWWHKLSKGAKIGVSAAAGVALTSAIVFPTLAATVWNTKEIKLVINKDKDVFIAQNVSLNKGKKYKFTILVTEAEHRTDSCDFVVAYDDGGTKTKEAISNLVIKSNLTVFEKVADGTERASLSNHQYCFNNTAEGSAVIIGSNCFLGDETKMICSFTSNVTVDNAVLAVSFD